MPPAPTMASGAAATNGVVWPAGLDRPPPRAVRLHQVIRWQLQPATGILAVLLTAFATTGALIACRRSLLLTHGVLTDGVVTALSGVDGSPQTSTRAYYSFTDPVPPGAIHPVHTGWSWVDRELGRRLSVGSVVTIAFLPRHPEVSSLDVALVASNSFNLFEGLTLLPAVPVMILGPVLAWYYLRERRLLRWGQAAMATVVEVRTVRRGGRSVAVRAHFEFRDDAGMVRHGVARDIGAADEWGAGAGERRYAVGDVVPALYDPLHSRRADLLPFRLLTLSPRPSCPRTPGRG